MKQNVSLSHLINAVEVYNGLTLPPLPRHLESIFKTILETTDEVIGILQKHLSRPDIRTCRIPLVIDFNTATKLDFWLGCKIFNDLPESQSTVLKDSAILMTRLLNELKMKRNQVDPHFAEQFFKHMLARVKKHMFLPYEIWRSDHRHHTFKQLRRKQVQHAFELLNTGVLDFDDTPTGDEIAEVNLNLWKRDLEYGTIIPPDFEIRAAIFKRYAYWAADLLLMIDYRSILYKLYQSFDKFDSHQRWALFDFDVQMKMVHQDIVALKPELEKYLNGSRDEEEKEEKLFASPRATLEAPVTYIINKVDQFNAVLGNRAEINH